MALHASCKRLTSCRLAGSIVSGLNGGHAKGGVATVSSCLYNGRRISRDVWSNYVRRPCGLRGEAVTDGSVIGCVIRATARSRQDEISRRREVLIGCSRMFRASCAGNS